MFWYYSHEIHVLKTREQMNFLESLFQPNGHQGPVEIAYQPIAKRTSLSCGGSKAGLGLRLPRMKRSAFHLLPYKMSGQGCLPHNVLGLPYVDRSLLRRSPCTRFFRLPVMLALDRWAAPVAVMVVTDPRRSSLASSGALNFGTGLLAYEFRLYRTRVAACRFS